MLTGVFKHLNEKLHYPEEFFEFFKEYTLNGEDGAIVIESLYTCKTRRIDVPFILYQHHENRYFTLSVGDSESMHKSIDVLKYHLSQINDPVASQISDSLTIMPLPKNQRLVNFILEQQDFLTTYMSMCDKISEVAIFFIQHPILPEAPMAVGDVISRNLRGIGYIRKGVTSHVRSFSRRRNPRYLLYKR